MQWKTALPHPNRPARSLALSPLLFRPGWRLAAFALALGLLLTASVGCSSKKTTVVGISGGNAVAKPTLRIGWPRGGEPALVRDSASSWAAQKNTRLEIVTYDPHAESGSLPNVDLLAVAPVDLPRWAAAGQLLPLPERLTSEATFGDLGYLPHYRQLLRWDGKKYALPLTGEAWLCCFREDLFRERGAAFQKQLGRPLTPPQTWEEVLEIARFFHEQRAAAGPPSPSLPPLPTSDLELEREFYMVAASYVRGSVREDPKQKASVDDTYSFHCNVLTGEARIDTAGFIHALHVLQQMQSYRAAQAVTEPLTWFRDGKAVLCLAPATPWIWRFQGLDSPVRAKFGLCRVPGSRFVFDPRTGERKPAAEVNQVPYLGDSGWLGVVPASAQQPEAAFALLAWLNELKTSRDIVTDPAHGGGPTRRDHLNTSKVSWTGLGLGPRTTEFVRDINLTQDNPQIINPALRLRLPEERRFRQALATRLRKAIVEKQDAAQVLREVADAWQQLIQEKGEARHRAEYRLSLGLNP